MVESSAQHMWTNATVCIGGDGVYGARCSGKNSPMGWDRIFQGVMNLCNYDMYELYGMCYRSRTACGVFESMWGQQAFWVH